MLLSGCLQLPGGGCWIRVPATPNRGGCWKTGSWASMIWDDGRCAVQLPAGRRVEVVSIVNPVRALRALCSIKSDFCLGELYAAGRMALRHHADGVWMMGGVARRASSLSLSSSSSLSFVVAFMFVVVVSAIDFEISTLEFSELDLHLLSQTSMLHTPFSSLCCCCSLLWLLLSLISHRTPLW